MPRYHILYKENPKEFYSKGRNITAENPISSIAAFEGFQRDGIIGKEALFLGMWDIDALNNNIFPTKPPDDTDLTVK